MYIPLATQVATALSTAAATLPAVHTDEWLNIRLGPSAPEMDRVVKSLHPYISPELRKEAHVQRINGSTWDHLKYAGPGPKLPLPRSTPTPSDYAYVSPMLPSPFWPDVPDQKYYRIGEDSLTGCIRDAVKEAGKERWIEIVHNGGPGQFLTKSRDNGLVGEDINRDSNEVKGLVDWVRTLAMDDNPNLDPATNDTEKCASLVRRFTSTQLVDELIIGWAEREGHIGRLPPTRPEPEETHVPVNLTYRGNRNPHRHLTTHGNLAIHGNKIMHQKRGDSKTGRYNNSTATGHTSSPENSGEIQDESLILNLRLISLVEPEIFELFGRNETLVDSFFDQPEITELLYEAIKEQRDSDNSAMADPAFPLKFLKDFVQNAMASGFTGP